MVQRTVAPTRSKMWTSALIMPLAKGEPDDVVKVRPIALCEPLLKLAEGVVMDLRRLGARLNRISSAFEPQTVQDAW